MLDKPCFMGVFQMLQKGLRGHKRFSDSDEFQDVNMLKKYCKAGSFIFFYTVKVS